MGGLRNQKDWDAAAVDEVYGFFKVLQCFEVARSFACKTRLAGQIKLQIMEHAVRNSSPCKDLEIDSAMSYLFHHN